MRVSRWCGARAWLAALLIPALSVSVFGQAAPTAAQPPQTPPAGQPAPAQPPPAPLPGGPVRAPASEAPKVLEQRTSGPVVQLSLDETVKRALEFNLDVQVQRINPRIQDLNIQSVESFWLPVLQNTTSYTDNTSTPADILLGDETITSSTTTNSLGVRQNVPRYGGDYAFAWANQRNETSADNQTFNPQFSGNFEFSYNQPLLRDLMVDNNRTQLYVNRKNREIADVQLQQLIVLTTRQVRNAYWDLVYARANLNVAQQSLDLSRQTLKDNRTRVEVGTMAPIDIVRAEAEVARNEEAAIIAASQIDTFEDSLRRLIFDPASPEYWTTNIDVSDQPPYPANVKDVDVEAAVAAAMQKRTDLVQQRKAIEASDLNIRYYKNQLLPAIDLFATYRVSALGGTTVPRGENPPPPLDIGWGDVYSTLFGRDNPFWRLGVTVSYPIGNSTEKVTLARARLQYQQSQLGLRDAELQAAQEVRNAGRNVNTNRRRVEAARATAVLSERTLEAEQKKFAVGLSSSFEVVQAQRDLAAARNSELQAIIDYVKSLVDFEAVQEAGTGTATGQTPAGGGGAGGR